MSRLDVDDLKTLSRKDVLARFNDVCREFEMLEHLKEWFPNGRNSIRVRLDTGKEFIFTYNSSDDWKIESVGSFLKGLNRGG